MNTYTAGQLAVLVGVSTRTVRYYDQRGILHPSSYTESGYRLYDDKALLKMQRILMLRFAGFTLEETQNILLMEQGQDLWGILTNQYQMILEKKRQLDEIAPILERVLVQNPLTDLKESLCGLVYALCGRRLSQSRNRYGALGRSMAMGKRPGYSSMELMTLAENKNARRLYENQGMCEKSVNFIMEEEHKNDSGRI